MPVNICMTIPLGRGWDDLMFGVRIVHFEAFASDRYQDLLKISINLEYYSQFTQWNQQFLKRCVENTRAWRDHS